MGSENPESSALPGTLAGQGAASQPSAASRWARRGILAAGGLVLAGFTAWGTAALYFDFRTPVLRVPLAVAYAGLTVFLFWRVRPRWRGLATWAALSGLLLAWWLSLAPSNNREWQRDVALLPWGEVEGTLLTLHNIRNCDYRSETDFDVRHYDKTLDLAKLRTLDYFQVHWGSPLIAHTMLSFGFADGEFVCVSIEARKEKNEGYSALRGFFRQYELTYVIADERDLVRLRTNFRKDEEVYLYRVKIPTDNLRRLFLEYVRQANALRAQPRWYNALSGNCTSNIRLNAARARGSKGAWDWRMLENGHLDELLYERGGLDKELPFAELRTRGHINARARAAGDARDFSAQIRAGLPGVEARP
jgi:hypothetical protein